jgi:hypothetical protein
MGRTLMMIGAAVFAAGAIIWLVSKTGLPLGRLPGDVVWKGKKVTVYAPFATMLIASVVLTIILNVITRIWRK